MNYKTGILLASLLFSSSAMSQTTNQDTTKNNLETKILSKKILPRPIKEEKTKERKSLSKPHTWDRYDLVKIIATKVGMETLGFWYHELMASKVRPAINLKTNYEKNLPFLDKREIGIVYYSRNPLNLNQSTQMGIYLFNNTDLIGTNYGIRFTLKRRF